MFPVRLETDKGLDTLLVLNNTLRIGSPSSDSGVYLTGDAARYEQRCVFALFSAA